MYTPTGLKRFLPLFKDNRRAGMVGLKWPVALVLVWILGLLPTAAMAQCNYGGCPTPSTPPTPSINPNQTVFRPAYGQTASYQLTVPNPLAWYGYTKWSTGQKTYPDQNQISTLSESGKSTGYYSYRAQTCYKQDNTCSGWSGIRQVYVLATPQPPGVTLSPVSACTTSLTVNWSPGLGYPASGATRYYDLEESTNGGGTYSPVPDRTATTSTAWSRTLPAGSAAYHYRVRAYYILNGQTSSKTAWTYKTISKPACDPGVPSGLTVSNLDPVAGNFTLSWNAPPSGVAERYELQENAGVSWQLLAQTVEPVRQYSVNGRAQATYSYRVRACTGTMCGNWSSTVQVEVIGAQVDVEYRYDALGRLVRVVENQTTRTGYCYDQAGNRYHVAQGVAGEDCPDEPPSEVPTGLSVGWRTGPSWEISWNPVVGASNYRLRLNNGTEMNLGSGTTTVYTQPAPNEDPNLTRPTWVQACFPDGHCGARAYF